MNLKYLLSLALAATLAAQTAPVTPQVTPQATPQVAPAEDTPSVTFTPSFASSYMFRGTQTGGAAFQPTLEYDNGNAALGVWSNVPLKHSALSQPELEFDWYGSYTVEVVKDTLSWVPGFTVYTYPHGGQTTFEPNLSLNYTVAGFTLTPKLYYDTVLKGPTYEGTIAYSIPTGKTKLNLALTGGAFHWANVGGARNRGNYASAGVTVPFQITDGSNLTLGLAYVRGFNNDFLSGSDRETNPAAFGRGVATVSYSISF